MPAKGRNEIVCCIIENLFLRIVSMCTKMNEKEKEKGKKSEEKRNKNEKKIEEKDKKRDKSVEKRLSES